MIFFHLKHLFYRPIRPLILILCISHFYACTKKPSSYDKKRPSSYVEMDTLHNNNNTDPPLKKHPKNLIVNRILRLLFNINLSKALFIHSPHDDLSQSLINIQTILDTYEDTYEDTY